LKAALITSYDAPPQYCDVPDPPAVQPGEMLVDVLAAGLHHVTRGRASGQHYSSAGKLPLIAGVDGVGRGTDGRLRYFVQEPGRAGSMSQRTVIALDHSIELPHDCDPALLAGAMNPAMASWLALRCRAPSFRRRLPFQRRRRVLVLGATGISGRLAVQIARHLGASDVIAAGRDAGRLAKLPALGATDTVTLGDPRLGVLASNADVVLDFVWGESAVIAMEAVLRHRQERDRPLDWIHLGSMAGDVAPLPGALLRSAKLQILGCGHGALSGREMLGELPELAEKLARGTFQVEVRRLPLSEVTRGWQEEAGHGRLVFTP
jgi:NADPH:quinone reductase-like Zn-dependent oxidoreductase